MCSGNRCIVSRCRMVNKRSIASFRIVSTCMHVHCVVSHRVAGPMQANAWGHIECCPSMLSRHADISSYSSSCFTVSYRHRRARAKISHRSASTAVLEYQVVSHRIASYRIASYRHRQAKQKQYIVSYRTGISKAMLHTLTLFIAWAPMSR